MDRLRFSCGLVHRSFQMVWFRVYGSYHSFWRCASRRLLLLPPAYPLRATCADVRFAPLLVALCSIYTHYAPIMVAFRTPPCLACAFCSARGASPGSARLIAPLKINARWINNRLAVRHITPGRVFMVAGQHLAHIWIGIVSWIMDKRRRASRALVFFFFFVLRTSGS